jgi:hypothetical protein
MGFEESDNGKPGPVKLISFNLPKIVGVFILLVFSIAAIFILIRDSQRLLAYSFNINLWLIVLSFIVECSGLLLAVPVWNKILGRFGNKTDLRDDLRIYSYSMLGVILPGGIWSAVSRVALYGRKGVPKFNVISASLVEFVLMGLAGLIVYGAITTLQPREKIWQNPIIAVTCIGLALILLQPPIFNRIVRFLQNRAKAKTSSVPMSYKDLGVWLLMESIVVILGGTAVFILLRSITIVSPNLIMQIISAWAIAVVTGNLFFWLPGTPVVRDGAMALILAQSLTPSFAIAFVLLVRIWTMVSILVLIGLVWLVYGQDDRQTLKKYIKSMLV